MSGETLISVQSISRKFCRSLNRSLVYGIRDMASDIMGRKLQTDQLRANEFWAVDDLSFEVKAGECLGVIGPNGAGKSTVLKMLNGVMLPDKGRITVRGRVGALIELGAGFHPALTGRENVYINGSILGLSKKEIDLKFDEIVAFAEVEEFIDSPVKFYSSGMYVRLGFAIAAHLEPQILLIDEVLAVGDAAFRLKCMRALREKVDLGTAIILVSHQMREVMNICNRAIWLHQGRLHDEGSPEVVCHLYERYMVTSFAPHSQVRNTTFFDPTAGVRFIGVTANGGAAGECFEFPQTKSIEIQLAIESERRFGSLFFNYALRTVDDVVVYGAREPLTPACADPNRYVISWRLPPAMLMPGTYKLEAALAYEYRWGTNIQELRPACVFTVTGTSKTIGVCNLPVTIAAVSSGQT